MIQIAIDPSGEANDLTRSAMEEIGDNFRSALNDLRCPEHNGPPVVTITGNFPESISVDVEACCEVLDALIDDALKAFDPDS